MSENPAITIRTAGREDAPVLCELIRELAAYERLLHEAQPDAGALATHLAEGAQPRCEALIAEDEAGRAVGFALYFSNYSTFLTRFGIYLEDLFVRPEARGRGVGMALLRRLAEIASARGCERLDWSVLTWNRLAIDFYEALGAKPMDEWVGMRLAGDALHALGRPAAGDAS